MSGSLANSRAMERVVMAAARRLAARDVADRDMDAFDNECEHAEQQHYLAMAAVTTAVVLREVAEELFEHLLNNVGPGMVVRPNVIPEVLRQWAGVVEGGEQE